VRVLAAACLALVLAGCAASGPSEADLVRPITITYVTEGGVAGGRDVQWTITTESPPETKYPLGRIQDKIYVISQPDAADCVHLMREQGFFGWGNGSPALGVEDLMKYTLTLQVGTEKYAVMAYDADLDKKPIERLETLAAELEKRAVDATTPIPMISP
jgi:hypothetical protein